ADSDDVALLSGLVAQRQTGPGVPDAHRAVLADGGQTPAVVAEGEVSSRRGPLQTPALLVRRGVPHLHDPILRHAYQPPAVGAEGKTADRAGVSLQGPDRLAGAGVPEAHQSIPAARDEDELVGTEAGS